MQGKAITLDRFIRQHADQIWRGELHLIHVSAKKKLMARGVLHQVEVEAVEHEHWVSPGGMEWRFTPAGERLREGLELIHYREQQARAEAEGLILVPSWAVKACAFSFGWKDQLPGWAKALKAALDEHNLREMRRNRL